MKKFIVFNLLLAIINLLPSLAMLAEFIIFIKNLHGHLAFFYICAFILFLSNGLIFIFNFREFRKKMQTKRLQYFNITILVANVAVLIYLIYVTISSISVEADSQYFVSTLIMRIVACLFTVCNILLLLFNFLKYKEPESTKPKHRNKKQEMQRRIDELEKKVEELENKNKKEEI